MLCSEPNITIVNMSGRRRERWLILKYGSCDLDTNRLLILLDTACHWKEKPRKHSGHDKIYSCLQTLEAGKKGPAFPLGLRSRTVQRPSAHCWEERTSVFSDNHIRHWKDFIDLAWVSCHPFPLGPAGRSCLFGGPTSLWQVRQLTVVPLSDIACCQIACTSKAYLLR